MSLPSERQFYMHVDTFQPTYKVWIFANTTHNHGPFHYVRGSHHNDERKLRWPVSYTHLTLPTKA